MVINLFRILQKSISIILFRLMGIRKLHLLAINTKF